MDSAHVEGNILVRYEGEGAGGDASSSSCSVVANEEDDSSLLPKKLVGVVFQDDMMLPLAGV